jgi:hypothetical protein
MTTIVEKVRRSVETVTHGPTEAHRLAMRRSIREEIAAGEVEGRTIKLLRAELAKIDGKADLAADAHAATCEPLQAELREIEARMKSRLTDRQPIDARDETRHVEIVGAIQKANGVLQVAVAAVEAEREDLAKEISRRNLAWCHNPKQVLQNKLAAPPLANRALYDEYLVCRSSLKWAHARETSATKRVQKLEAEIRAMEKEPGHWQERTVTQSHENLRVAKLESTTASAEVVRLKDEVNEIRTRLIEE